jgi:hypothetical protein
VGALLRGRLGSSVDSVFSYDTHKPVGRRRVIEKCDALAGAEKDACVNNAKVQYGKA